MATAAILINRKINVSQPQLERFQRNLAQWSSSTFLTCPTVKNLKFRKSKMAAAAILKNRKIIISRPRFMRFWRNLARWRSSTFLTSPTVKNVKIQDGGDCRSLNPKIAISQPQLDLTQWRSSMLLIVKNLKFRTSRWRRPPSWKNEKYL